jgi:hypothetical protein
MERLKMNTVKHIEQPRQTVRVVLPEVNRTSLRISKWGKEAIAALSEASGKPEWMLFDELVSAALVDAAIAGEGRSDE